MSTSTHPSVRRVTALALATGATLSAAALTPAHAATADRAGQMLHAKLTASGDPDGSGSATFRLVKAKGKVCVTATWKHIQAPDSAHIHKKSDSSVVVTLTSAVTGGAH